MSTQVLWVPGPLPGLNELLGAKRHLRGKSDCYGKLKRLWGNKVALAARVCKLAPVEAATLRYELHELNRRRDPSNAAAAAIKLVEDGLVLAGILPGDGWRHVHGFSVTWLVSNNPGVKVTIEAAA